MTTKETTPIESTNIYEFLKENNVQLKPYFACPQCKSWFESAKAKLAEKDAEINLHLQRIKGDRHALDKAIEKLSQYEARVKELENLKIDEARDLFKSYEEKLSRQAEALRQVKNILQDIDSSNASEHLVQAKQDWLKDNKELLKGLK